MTIRERVEQMEAQRLSPYAALSQNSKGRDRWEEPCEIFGLVFRGIGIGFCTANPFEE